jgi:hypothetical protein
VTEEPFFVTINFPPKRQPGRIFGKVQTNRYVRFSESAVCFIRVVYLIYLPAKANRRMVLRRRLG